MATKPYVSGGRYIDRMSDYCKSCSFEPTERVGETTCPFTTLYWDFLARHADQLRNKPRIARQVRAAQALPDLAVVRPRAADVQDRLAAGQL